jgi:hypothetical protein
MKTVTLKELGQQLPIGRPDGKKLIKDFSLRPYKAQIDRHMGLWNEENAGKYTPGQLVACRVAKFISLMANSWAGESVPHDDKGDSTAEAEGKVYGWHFTDVMYAYIYARAKLDPRFPVDFVCPEANCQLEKVIAFDLRETEVVMLEDPSELECWLPITESFKLRDNKACKKIRLQPTPWSVMTKPGVIGGNTSAIAFAAMEDAICGVNGSDAPYRMVDSELDEIGKMDTVAISDAMPMKAGVQLATPVSCPKKGCKGKIADALDWTYEYFFGSSLQMLAGLPPLEKTSTS